jgi:hypothetical protein
MAAEELPEAEAVGGEALAGLFQVTRKCRLATALCLRTTSESWTT